MDMTLLIISISCTAPLNYFISNVLTSRSSSPGTRPTGSSRSNDHKIKRLSDTCLMTGSYRCFNVWSRKRDMDMWTTYIWIYTLEFTILVSVWILCLKMIIRYVDTFRYFCLVFTWTTTIRARWAESYELTDCDHVSVHTSRVCFCWCWGTGCYSELRVCVCDGLINHANRVGREVTVSHDCRWNQQNVKLVWLFVSRMKKTVRT